MTGPLAILGGPRRYVQGPGALDRIGEFAGELGARLFVVGDGVALDLLRPRLERSLAGATHFAAFGGECRHDEITRLTETCRAIGGDVVIGLGGGKAIDTAKGVALRLDLPLLVAPTIASNDAPTSRIIVVYDEHHAIAEILRLRFNPDIVLVDTAVIAAAPVRFLRAGIGDAISKKFEVERAVAAGGLNFFQGRPLHLTATIARACYDEIRAHAEAAVADVKRQRVSEAVERVVEANILLSGLAFESGGLAAAHALTRGFTALPETKAALHGETVAFGLLVQLVLEDRPAEFLAELLAFYATIGLPRTLAELGLADAGEAQLRAIAAPTCRAVYIGNMAGAIDEDRVVAALRRADALGRDASGRRGAGPAEIDSRSR